MALKKKRKIAKKVVHKKATKHKLHGMDHDFIIISGGGLVIVILALFLIF